MLSMNVLMIYPMVRLANFIGERTFYTAYSECWVVVVIRMYDACNRCWMFRFEICGIVLYSDQMQLILMLDQKDTHAGEQSIRRP